MVLPQSFREPQDRAYDQECTSGVYMTGSGWPADTVNHSEIDLGQNLIYLLRPKELHTVLEE